MAAFWYLLILIFCKISSNIVTVLCFWTAESLRAGCIPRRQLIMPRHTASRCWRGDGKNRYQIQWPLHSPRPTNTVAGPDRIDFYGTRLFGQFVVVRAHILLLSIIACSLCILSFSDPYLIISAYISYGFFFAVTRYQCFTEIQRSDTGPFPVVRALLKPRVIVHH